MQVTFWPHKPSRSFLDRLEKLVSEEPAIKLIIKDSEDEPSLADPGGVRRCRTTFSLSENSIFSCSDPKATSMVYLTRLDRVLVVELAMIKFSRFLQRFKLRSRSFYSRECAKCNGSANFLLIFVKNNVASLVRDRDSLLRHLKLSHGSILSSRDAGHSPFIPKVVV